MLMRRLAALLGIVVASAAARVLYERVSGTVATIAVFAVGLLSLVAGLAWAPDAIAAVGGERRHDAALRATALQKHMSTLGVVGGGVVWFVWAAQSLTHALAGAYVSRAAELAVSAVNALTTLVAALVIYPPWNVPLVPQTAFVVVVAALDIVPMRANSLFVASVAVTTVRVVLFTLAAAALGDALGRTAVRATDESVRLKSDERNSAFAYASVSFFFVCTQFLLFADIYVVAGTLAVGGAVFVYTRWGHSDDAVLPVHHAPPTTTALHPRLVSAQSSHTAPQRFASAPTHLHALPPPPPTVGREQRHHLPPSPPDSDGASPSPPLRVPPRTGGRRVTVGQQPPRRPPARTVVKPADAARRPAPPAHPYRPDCSCPSCRAVSSGIMAGIGRQ